MARTESQEQNRAQQPAPGVSVPLERSGKLKKTSLHGLEKVDTLLII